MRAENINAPLVYREQDTIFIAWGTREFRKWKVFTGKFECYIIPKNSGTFRFLL